MNEQRKDILNMLSEGKITPAEAEQLIAALERGQPATTSTSDARSKTKARYLRVVMDATDEMEPMRLNVRVPLQLLRAGVRLAALIPAQALVHINAELDKTGWQVDLTQLKPEHLEALIEHLDEVTVEMDSTDTTLRVFCE